MTLDRHRFSPSLGKAALDITKNAPPGDMEAKRRLVYRWVMDNIEDQPSMDGEASHILESRRGSRARLFYTLLRILGDDPKLAVIQPFGTDDTPTDMADPRVLSELAVLAGGRFVAFGMRGSPYRFLSPLLRNRPAWVLDSSPRNVRTDAGAVPLDDRRIQGEIALSPAGDATAKMHEILTGLFAAQWREATRTIPREDWERRFEQNYLGGVLRGASLKRLDIQGIDDWDRPIDLTYEAGLPTLTRQQGGILYLPPLFYLPLNILFSHQSERKHDFVIPAPLASDVEIAITLPPGHAATELPQPVTIESPFGTFSMSVTASAGRIVIRRAVQVHAGRIPLSRYEEFVRFCTQVDTAAGREIPIRKSSLRPP